MTPDGLRERSKARRKAAITEAAMNLFAEQGYEATTVADIAAAAEVAPRTVALYFATKQDIALSSFSDAAERLTAALRDRDPDKPALSVMKDWLIAEDEQPDDCDGELSARMFAANPELAALRTARMANAIDQASVAIASDLRIEPTDPIVPIITAATAAVVLELATKRASAERDVALAGAIRFLDAGMHAVSPADQGPSTTNATSST
jgi:AcrR family transcriptional regulator